MFILVSSTLAAVGHGIFSGRKNNSHEEIIKAGAVESRIATDRAKTTNGG